MARVFETDITLNAQRELRLADADSSAYVGFKAPATITTNRIWTLPSADGTSGQVLSTDGSGVLSWATAGGGGGGLTHFVESESTAAPNATVPVDAFTATDASYTNIDVALVAKGTGATLAQVPDGTAAGGNKRGTYATDWQKKRSSATNVASGNYSVIGGGESNRASEVYATISGGFLNTVTGNRGTVAGGQENQASSAYTFVGGGKSNTASLTSAAVVGGQSNTASSFYSFVGGGESNEAKTSSYATCVGGNLNDATGQYSFAGGGVSNTASGTGSSISGGNTNTASGNYSFIGGGLGNTTNGSFSAIFGGRLGTTRGINSYLVFPACSLPIADALGVTQSALLLLARQTTDATATVLASSSSAASTTNQVILPNNSAYHFKGSVIATVTGGGDTASWEFKGAIKRGANAASTAIVGTVIKDVVAYDAGASAWDVTFTADTTNGGLKVEVTGAAATTIRWVAKLETTEVTY